MILFRKVHKWLGLLIGLQVLVWVVTGSLISVLDARTVGGGLTRQALPSRLSTANIGRLVGVEQLPLAQKKIRSVQLESFFSHAVYRVTLADSKQMFNAQTGRLLVIDEALAEQIARASYRGAGQLVSSQKLVQGSDEMRGVPGALWRSDFSDSVATRVYVSAEDGSMLAHRNNRWELVDFLLMLHFMDYARADNFNNPQIIVVAFGTLWLAFSGLLLVFNSFSRNDFQWLPGGFLKGKELVIYAGAPGEQKDKVSLDGSLSLFAGLLHREISLPSNCDGSGSCGLCKVLYDKIPPAATAVDRQWVSADKLALGERLACQHKPRPEDSIVVPDAAYRSGMIGAEVVSTHWLTPLLKEIRVRPDEPTHFNPGDYFQFQIPACDVRRDQLDIPAEFKPAWDAMAIPERWHCDAVRFRAYSVATAPGQDECLAFTVRFAPPPAGSDHFPGLGSGYMCSLGRGNRVIFGGPAGEFKLQDSEREKIFIGGGAGMAPLKSMVVHLLKNEAWKGKVRFWYGARNQREILYRDSFESLAAELPNFEWRVGLSDLEQGDDWEGERGFIHQLIHDLVLTKHTNLLNCEFYLCGPPLMLAASREMLRELGVPDRLVHFDDFGS